MTAPLRITTRAIGIIVLIELVFDLFGPFPGPPNILFGGQGSALYFRYVAVPGVVAGVAALWRPSFLAPLFLYYVGWRELIGTVSGIRVVDTDYLGMIDVGYFATLGTFIVICATSPWTLNRFPFPTFPLARPGHMRGCALPDIQPDLGLRGRRSMGSYFWSGIAKIQVSGDNPLTWVLHNPTQTSIVIGLERGTTRWRCFPTCCRWSGTGSSADSRDLNIAVFLAQLLAPLAALSVRSYQPSA